MDNRNSCRNSTETLDPKESLAIDFFEESLALVWLLPDRWLVHSACLSEPFSVTPPSV